MSSIYDYEGNEIAVTPAVFEPSDNDIPIVTITGTLPVEKTDGEVNVEIDYWSQTERFKDYATLKVQGDSSTAYPKKNFTVKLFSNSDRTAKDKRVFRDWKSANKFVLKANWIDHTHSRNIVNARLWTQIYKSRSDFNTLPSALVNGHIAVDGFPVKVFANGVYQGLYTWNVPKSALFGINDNSSIQALVQGDRYTDSTSFRSSESIGGWSDETHDSMPSTVSSGWLSVVSFVYTSSDADFVTNFSNHFDKQSIIDQYIFVQVGNIVDNIGKNQTFFTYDCQKWYGGMYDMDGTWGLKPWNVSTWLPYNTVFQDDYAIVIDGGGETNLLYERLGNLFSSDIQARYQDLRESVLSADNIVAEFERFTSAIPPYLYDEDYASTTGGGNFTNIPLVSTSNIQQIRQFVVDRLAYVDSQILS